MGIIVHNRNRYRDDRISYAEAKRLGIVTNDKEFEAKTGRIVKVKELAKVEKDEPEIKEKPVVKQAAEVKEKPVAEVKKVTKK